MKYLILGLCLIFSSSVFARQYFQCSVLEPNMTDVMVVNLISEKKGTLFLSSGMENDNERLLFDIELSRVEKNYNVYKAANDSIEGELFVPKHSIGKPLSRVDLEVIFSRYNFTFSCFSKIYND